MKKKKVHWPHVDGDEWVRIFFASQGCAVHKHDEDVLVKPKSLCCECCHILLCEKGFTTLFIL